MVSCMECTGNCCKEVTIIVETPKTQEELEDIKWYLYHKNVTVYIDHNDDWCVHFKTNCKMLTKDNMCKIYEKRPPVCRKHPQEECDVNTGPDSKVLFKNIRDYEKWLKNQPNSL